MMISAAYGRMRIGRCLEDEGIDLQTSRDPRVVGCSVDVVHLLDKKCFGKNQCDMKAVELDRKRDKPCHASYKQYLEVAYECVVGRFFSVEI